MPRAVAESGVLTRIVPRLGITAQILEATALAETRRNKISGMNRQEHRSASAHRRYLGAVRIVWFGSSTILCTPAGAANRSSDEFSSAGLEVSTETVLSVTTG